MNSVALRGSEITATVYPKARRLALGRPLAAAPQLTAQLTQVTLKILVIIEVCDCRFNGNNI
jgi:hypothetical protein